MAINVQHQPNLTDYIQAVSLAARNVEQNKRAQAQGELAAKLKSQEDALRSQVVQRGVAGGGGSVIRSDPTSISNPGSNLSTYSQYSSPMIAPQQRMPQMVQFQPQQYGGTYPQQQPSMTPSMQLVTNPYVQQAGSILGSLTSPLSALGSAVSYPLSQYASAFGQLF